MGSVKHVRRSVKLEETLNNDVTLATSSSVTASTKEMSHGINKLSKRKFYSRIAVSGDAGAMGKVSSDWTKIALTATTMRDTVAEQRIRSERL